MGTAYSKVIQYTHETLENNVPYYLLTLSCGHTARYPKTRNYPKLAPQRIKCVACKREKAAASCW